MAVMWSQERNISLQVIRQVLELESHTWSFFSYSNSTLFCLFLYLLCLHFNSWRLIYTSYYCFACDQNIFIPATKDVYIHPSSTSPAAKNVNIGPHQVTFYRCLVVAYILPWLLSYIYKPLIIIEIVSNCNNNSQVGSYTSILQGFSKTLVAEVYIEIHIQQTKEFGCMRQVNTVEEIAF